MTGAAYIRVSTEDQIEFSPDSQMKKIQEYASTHNIVVPKHFVFLDEGISGRSATKRPAFLQMIGMAKTKPKPFDVILVWKFSRFARNRQDSIFYKSMLRKHCGIDVVSITEPLSGDATSILIEALLEAMDEYYSINLSQEVKRGMYEKFSRGGVVSAPPFGYYMGTKHFEIEEKQAEIVQMIYEDFLNHMSVRQITVKLNRMGIRSKRNHLFEHRTVEYILKNPVYTGKLRRCINGKTKEIELIQGLHKPVITDEVFQKVQQMFEENEKKKHVRIEIKSKGSMLTGLICCSNCGSILTQALGGKGLQCPRYTKGLCDCSHYVSCNKIEHAVLKKIEEDMLAFCTTQYLEWHVKDLEKKLAPTVKNWHKRLVEQQYRKLERIQLAYEDGIDCLEEYIVKKRRIVEEIKKIECNEKVDAIQNVTTYEIQLTWKQLMGMLKSEDVSVYEKHEILKAFTSHIVFNRRKNTIQICYLE